jgi:allophanate hydrolase
MPTTATDRVRTAFERIAVVDRPEVWITLRERDDVLAEAASIDAAPPGPLSGRVIAVKDNIDVAGMPTTAACPAFGYAPEADAPAVAALRAAGAIVLGKTNLDQFATGLVGTRSPYGAVRDAARPQYVSGGSSSGSAVAVALGVVDAALGTDTAGSGRVPAAFQGLVGIKPTRGLVSTAGVVPACRTLDCVSVLTRDLALGQTVLWLMAAADPPAGDPALGIRAWPPGAPLAAPPRPRIAVPAAGSLTDLSPAALAAFAAVVQALVAGGATVREIDLEPFMAAGRLLYEGAFVAERYAAVGPFVDAHRDDVDPTVGAIIHGAAEIPAARLVCDGEALELLRVAADAELSDADAVLVPTAPRQPTIAEVAADPIAVNAALGRYTTFANLLDLCAVALPAGEADGGRFGVTLLGRAFDDRVVADIAARMLGEAHDAPTTARAGTGPRGIALLVVGAHRRGQPLNGQLTDAGARFVEVALTSPDYRMYALATDPPKPGLVRVGAGDGDGGRVGPGGRSIEGELWELPAAAVGPFLAALPRPMMLGPVTLADGRSVVGFGCEAAAVDGAPDISDAGSWPAYLSRGR